MTLSIQLITLLCLAAAVQSQFIPCDVGFHLHNGICYHLAPGYYRHEEAQNYCNIRRSTLLILHDIDQLNYIRDTIWGYGYYWYRIWLGMMKHNGAYHWQGHVPMNYTNWRVNEFENNPTFQAGPVVNLFSADWTDNAPIGIDAANFVCMYPHTDSAPGTPMSYLCKENYHDYDGDCYTFSNSLVTYTAALKICQDDNATLVSIHSAEEEMFIVTKASERSIPELPLTYKLWIGLNLEYGEYKWWQGGLQTGFIDYKNWAENAPTKRSDRVHLVIKDVEKRDFSWTDEVLDTAGYVCRYSP